MNGPMLFQFIGQAVDNALNTYINVTASSVANTFITTAITLTALNIAFQGTLTVFGRIESPLSTFLLTMSKFIVISIFAVSSSEYMDWVVGSIRGMETAFTAAFAGSEGIAPNSVYAVADDALAKGWGLAADLYERAENRTIAEFGTAVGELLNSSIIAVATGIIAIPAGAMIVGTKAILSLALGIGPVFVLCLMWPVTKQFFDRWFSVVMTCLIQIALLAAVLSFAVRIFLAFVTPADMDDPTQSPLFTSLQLVGVTCVMLWLLYRTYDLGGQLAGGLATTAITFGQVVRGAVAPVTGAARVVNRESTRRDLSTGHMVTAGRLNHIAAGNTALNQAYRQHFLESIGKNWSKPNGGRVSNGG